VAWREVALRSGPGRREVLRALREALFDSEVHLALGKMGGRHGRGCSGGVDSAARFRSRGLAGGGAQVRTGAA